MGTVKYTGPVASFHCPTNAEIRSLKVYFSPKQLGEGDPSPENVRPIEGWNGVSTYHKGKNLLNISDDNIIYENYSWSNNGSYYSINDTTITLYNTEAKSFMVCFSALEITEKLVGKQIILSAITTGTGDYGIFRSDLDGANRSSSLANPYTIVNSDIGRLLGVRIRINGYTGLYTVNNIQLEFGSTPTPYEPYQSSTANYEFGVLGKNKFNPYFDWTKGSPYRYIRLPELETECNLSFVEKDSSISTSDIYFGFSYEEPISSAAMGRAYHWCMKTGNIQQSLNNRVNEYTNQELNGKLCKYLVVYPRTDDVYNRLTSRYNIQLELGSTATAYEPYDPNHTVYGGWVDLISGEVCENWFKTTKKLSDCTTKSIYDNGITYYGYDPLSTLSCYANEADNTIKGSFSKCSIAKHSWSGSTTISNHYYLFKTSSGNTRILLYLLSNSIESDDTEFEIAFQLAEPIQYYLAPTQLQTFLGQNNVWSNADYVEVEYDLHETQDILNRKNFIIANQPHVAKPAAAPLQNFVTDVPAPLKECKVHFAPVQDLHGYDSPWPAGGGKNIAKPYDNSYVSSTYISFDYSAANGTFRCYGTASASSTHSSPSATNAVNNGATFTLPAGTYTLSIIDGDGANIYAQCVSSDETVLAETTSYTTFTTNESLTVFVRLKVAAGATIDSTVKIQLEAGSTATSYEPYENICPISGWTGVEVYRTGKNLLHDKHELSKAQIAGDGSGGYQIKSANVYRVLSVEVPINTDLHIHKEKASGSNLALGAELAQIGISVSYIGSMTNYHNRDFNTGNNPYAYLMVGNNVAVDDSELLWQLELGSTATDYEPYTGTTIPITFPTEAGTIYGGYVDLVTGEVWETWSESDLSAWSWTQASTNRIRSYSVTDMEIPKTTGTYGKFIGEQVYPATQAQNLTNFPNGIAVMQAGYWYKYFDGTNYPKGKICYKLATPQLITTLTPTQLKTLRGTNNIWSNSNDNIKIAYWKH